MSALGKYSAQLRSRIDAAWAKPASLAGVKVATTVIFDVSASGRVTNARLRPGSGNAAFDQSVLAAFRKVISAGPTPTGQEHSFTMTFRMTD
jgi:TonB family protein